MTNIFYDGEVNIQPLLNRQIAVIGYGNQAHAHAQNLADSGCSVRIGLRPQSTSWARAEEAGFVVMPVSDACAWADFIALMVPDQEHRRVYDGDIAPHLTTGNVLLVAHGFSIVYGEIRPPDDVDVVMVAPVSPGQTMRALYVQGNGVPAVYAVSQDSSGSAPELALAYAVGLGCGRVGIVESTFREETETDLFGEQAVLCGGLPLLMQAGFETLVRAGYQPELAYFECIHQVKLIVDLIYERGFSSLYERISDTAEFGAYSAGPKVMGTAAKAGMQGILEEVRSGAFARSWIADYTRGMDELQKLRKDNLDRVRLIDSIGDVLRSAMQPQRDDPVS